MTHYPALTCCLTLFVYHFYCWPWMHYWQDAQLSAQCSFELCGEPRNFHQPARASSISLWLVSTVAHGCWTIESRAPSSWVYHQAFAPCWPPVLLLDTLAGQAWKNLDSLMSSDQEKMIDYALRLLTVVSMAQERQNWSATWSSRTTNRSSYSWDYAYQALPSFTFSNLTFCLQPQNLTRSVVFVRFLRAPCWLCRCAARMEPPYVPSSTQASWAAQDVISFSAQKTVDLAEIFADSWWSARFA